MDRISQRSREITNYKVYKYSKPSKGFLCSAFFLFVENNVNLWYNAISSLWKEGGEVLKIAICDDEKEFCDSAERMLKLYMEEKTVPYQADVFNIP